jgi:2-phosphosulfolactate phosphatase
VDSVPSVAIDCFVNELGPYPPDAVVVGIDVIRSTTTAITAVVGGLRCHVAPSLEEAARIAGTLEDPLLAGELGGNMPFGFDVTNSPVAMASLAGSARPVVLLSSSGTHLLSEAAARYRPTFVACLRNWEAQAREILSDPPEEVVLVGAGTRGEFREEDQLCAAWIAERLIDSGYRAADETTAVVERWRGASVEQLAEGRSARYLRDTGQLADLSFILEHVGDLPSTFVMEGSEVVLRGQQP